MVHCALATAKSVHVACMNESAPALKLIDAVLAGESRERDRPPFHWKGQMESDLTSLGIPNWLKEGSNFALC